MKKRSQVKEIFSKVSNKKTLLIAVPIIAVMGGATIYAMADKTPEPQFSAQSVSNVPTETDTSTPVSQTTTQPASPATTEPTPEPAPTPPANPYQEGFNLWHVYNRRIAVGKSVPTDLPPADSQACVYLSKRSGYTMSKTPTQYSIACHPPGAQNSTLGFVESVNADGSIVVSYTYYSAGFNKYVEVTVPKNELNRYSYFIQ